MIADLHKIPAATLLQAIASHPELVTGSPRQLADRCLSLASSIFGISRQDLLSHSKRREIAQPRLILLASLYELGQPLGISQTTVAQLIGKRDHGAVIHAIKRAPQIANQSSHFAGLVHSFRVALALPPFSSKNCQSSVISSD